jgi:hypothetical protein
MKRFLAPLLAIFGVSSAAQSQPQITSLDPNTIRYTMPTVAADSLEFIVPTAETFVGAPQFHEDEWSQVEFFPKSRLPEIKKLLTEYKPFELANRGQYGWDKIYARHIERRPVVAGHDAVGRLGSLLGATEGNSPILLTSSSALGQVKGGFTLPIAADINLYGLRDESGITVLGAILNSGADDLKLTKAFITLNNAEQLVLVDWRSQLILVSSQPNGDVDVWRP